MGSVFGRHNRTRGLGFFARTSCSYLPPSSHVYFQEQTLHYGGKNSILGLVIAMKQKFRPASAAVCAERWSEGSLSGLKISAFCRRRQWSHLARCWVPRQCRGLFLSEYTSVQTTALLCRGADDLASEIPVQSFVLLTKRSLTVVRLPWKQVFCERRVSSLKFESCGLFVPVLQHASRLPPACWLPLLACASK